MENQISKTRMNELLTATSNIYMEDYLKSRLADTIFDVEKRPLPYIKPQMNLTNNPMMADVKGWVADWGTKTNRAMIVNKDNESFVSVVGKDYTIVKNIQILSAINQMIGSANADRLGLELIDVAIFKDSRVKYVFIAHGLRKKILGEAIVPRITVINSYGGETSFKIIGGVNVLVCTNGLMFPKTVIQYSRMHQGVIEIEDLLEKFIETSGESDKFAERTFRILKEVEFTPDYLVKTISLFNRDAQDRFVEVLSEDKDNGKNYYGLLQAGTNVITHHMDRDKEVTHKLESTFIPKLIRYSNVDGKHYINRQV